MLTCPVLGLGTMVFSNHSAGDAVVLCLLDGRSLYCFPLLFVPSLVLASDRPNQRTLIMMEPPRGMLKVENKGEYHRSIHRFHQPGIV